jgi:hypothetical protein
LLDDNNATAPDESAQPAMITVAQFSSLQEALNLRMALESAGIAAFIPDENIASVAPPYLFVGSGVRLQVTEEDLAAAQAIIADLRTDAAP